MKRKLVLGSGIISLISSLIALALYGIYLVVMGGYVLVTLSFVIPFAGFASGDMSGIFSIFLMLLMVCAIPTAVGIIGLVFATKLLNIWKMQDYYYKAQKGRLITYIVFFFIFAIVMLGYGIFMMQSGGIPDSTLSSSFVVQMLNSLPFGLLIGPMYLATAILLLVDVIRNKNKIFKANIPAPMPTREQLLTQQITQQPQIITLKPGEELPEYLKGRVVPIPPQKVSEEAAPKPEQAPKPEKKEGTSKKSK